MPAARTLTLTLTLTLTRCLQREEVMLVALQDGDLAVGRVLVTVEVVDAVLEEAHG